MRFQNRSSPDEKEAPDDSRTHIHDGCMSFIFPNNIVLARPNRPCFDPKSTKRHTHPFASPFASVCRARSEEIRAAAIRALIAAGPEAVGSERHAMEEGNDGKQEELIDSVSHDVINVH